MAKYIYPAIFTPENGTYSVDFPDLEGCFTCGDDLKHALEMAQDVLALTLVDYEDSHKEIPAMSPPTAIKLDGGEFVSLLSCDTVAYRRTLNARAVKNRY